VNTLEVTLRQALERGDIRDGAFRRRVYVAAASALERSAKARPNTPPERLRAQTEDLTAIIEAIEQELRDDEQDAAAPPSRRAPSPAQSAGAPRPSPPPYAPAHGTLHVEPKPAEPSQNAATPPPAQPGRKSSPFSFSRGPFAVLVAGVVLTALLVMGVIWVVVTGAFVSEEARDTAVRNPPPVLREESFVGTEQPASDGAQAFGNGAGSGDWIVLFSPADPTTLRLAGGATASIQSDPFGAYARLTTPSADSVVRIDVPAGTLQRIAGRSAEVSLRARTDDSNPAQISVTCDLGPLGDCGRRRFNLGPAETEYLFRFELPDARPPFQAGSLDITTGLGELNSPIRLIGVSIRPAES